MDFELERGSKRIVQFQEILIHYWYTNGRKELPWRLTRDPWKILLAEVLLRKTTSAQAVPVFSIISSFTPGQIITMAEQEISEILKPLGLYRIRAKQLKAVAEKVEENGIDALGDPNFLASLPGIGKYIGNSVLCVSYGIPKPALDTNMIRVIQRVFSYQVERSRAREDKKLWEFAETLVPENACREFNWAVLDLAAAVCTIRDPKCNICPLFKICDFAQRTKADNQLAYPD